MRSNDLFNFIKRQKQDCPYRWHSMIATTLRVTFTGAAPLLDTIVPLTR